ncbi:MAG TPA: hypothetical protein VIU11_27720 [Nakamurella sp.]
MLGDQRVQPSDPLQTLRQPGLRQSPTVHVLDLHIVVILGPVIPDEQQHPGRTPNRSPDINRHSDPANSATY